MSSSEARTRLLNFVRIEPFHRLRAKHGLTEDDLIRIENEILAAPRKRDEIRGSGGFRKLRLSLEGSSKGKSGSYRVLYLYLQAYATVCLLVFGKNEKAKISKADTNALAKSAVVRVEGEKRIEEHRAAN
jgi:mRNA-degrading endonuclease RelE of RelBE toxin-antitoxin system